MCPVLAHRVISLRFGTWSLWGIAELSGRTAISIYENAPYADGLPSL
jgi:hypothetical protein